MSLFKKKEPRVVKDDDPLFIKLWYTPRYHAILGLALYFIFFLIVALLLNASATNSKNNSSVAGSSAKELFNTLNSKNISYNYTIKDGNNIYYFSGIDKDGGIYGNLLHNGEATNVNIKNGACAVGDYLNGQFVPKYTLCPENISYFYFDYMNIYDLIKDKKGTKTRDGNSYYFDLKNKLELKIYFTSDKLIHKIELVDNSVSYVFTYTLSNINFSNDNNILNEIAKNAIKSSYDQKYYRSRKKIKINKETYVENFFKLLADNKDLSTTYQIDFESVSSEPLNIKLNIKSKANEFTIELNNDNFNFSEYINQ